MKQPAKQQSIFQQLAQRILSIGIGLLAVMLFCREFFLFGFQKIIGDRGDGCLIMSIHEHWYRLLTGKEGFFDLGFFYPEQGVLGFSDTFFLGGLFHSLFRVIGLDVFISFELVQVASAIIGYFGMMHWLIHHRKVKFIPALFASFLFVTASPIFNSHIQLHAVWFVPWVLVLGERAWKDLLDRSRYRPWNFAGLCFLYSILVYSTFYIAWFLLLFAAIWCIAYALLEGTSGIKEALVARYKSWRFLIPGIVLLLVFGGLFLVTYLPVLSAAGGRSYEEILHYFPAVWELVYFGKTNLLWGKVASYLLSNYPSWFGSLDNIGFTFLFLLVSLIVVIGMLRKSRFLSIPEITIPRVTALATLISLFLMIRIGNFTLWVIPFYIIPGADAIRVVQRYSILLLVPMLYLIAISFSWFQTRQAGLSRNVLIVVTGSMLLFEQFPSGSNSFIDRDEYTSRIKELPEPPTDAAAFQLKGTDRGMNGTAILNCLAIIFSQHWDLPTVSGHSGFIPKNWNLSVTDSQQEQSNLIRWGNVKGIQGKVYIFNYDSNTWGESIAFPTHKAPLKYTDRNLLDMAYFPYIAGEGWSGLEIWGVWSDGKRSVLYFPPVITDTDNIRLIAGFQPFLTNDHREQSLVVLLNGEEIYRNTFLNDKREGQVVRTLSREEIRNGFTLELMADKAISPEQLGISADSRVLGVGLKKLVLETF